MCCRPTLSGRFDVQEKSTLLHRISAKARQHIRSLVIGNEQTRIIYVFGRLTQFDVHACTSKVKLAWKEPLCADDRRRCFVEHELLMLPAADILGYSLIKGLGFILSKVSFNSGQINRKIEHSRIVAINEKPLHHDRQTASSRHIYSSSAANPASAPTRSLIGVFSVAPCMTFKHRALQGTQSPMMRLSSGRRVLRHARNGMTDNNRAALLHVCRQVYSEAIITLYQSLNFEFRSLQMLTIFCEKTPSDHLAKIQHLHLVIDFSQAPMRKCYEPNVIKAHFPGLRTLVITDRDDYRDLQLTRRRLERVKAGMEGLEVCAPHVRWHHLFSFKTGTQAEDDIVAAAAFSRRTDVETQEECEGSRSVEVFSELE